MRVQKIDNQPSFKSLMVDDDILMAVTKHEDVIKFRREIALFLDLLDQAAEGADTHVQPIIRNGRIKRIEVGSYFTASNSMAQDFRTLGLMLLDTFKPNKYLEYTSRLNFENFTGEQLLDVVKATTKGAVKRFGRTK